MRPLVVVIRHEHFEDANPTARVTWAPDREVLVVNSFDEPLHLAIGFGRVRTDELMPNTQTATRLLKPGTAGRVKGEAHRKHQVVVGHHRVDGIAQPVDDLFKFTPVFQGGQILQVEVHELARPRLLIPPDDAPHAGGQATPPGLSTL